MQRVTASATFTAREYRDTMGLFATGVAVVTFSSAEGRPYGMTANCVASVSLEPPLLLVCVARTARSHDVAVVAETFSVHILRRDQEDVCRLFASREPDKFDHVSWSMFRGAPTLETFVARLTCRQWATYPGGDHSIIVGEVTDLEAQDPEAPPLVFHRGRYPELVME